jgi:hypothetical protein
MTCYVNPGKALIIVELFTALSVSKCVLSILLVYAHFQILKGHVLTV